VVDRGKEKTAMQLRQEFPTFRFFVLPADDIRSKSEKNIKGVLDENYNVRPELAEAMRDLFNKMNSALHDPRAP
jgi:hypothetical protein